MAKQGLIKQHKVVSSGRLVSSGRGTAGKKKLQGRRPASVDSGYSLYSTDSEDQVTTIHKGLDRCAALLNGILQTEKTDGKSSHSKPKRPAPLKSKLKLAPGKDEAVKRMHSKQIGLTTHSHARPAVQKTILSSRSFPGVKEQHCIHTLETHVGQAVPGTGLSAGSLPATGQHTQPEVGLSGMLPVTEQQNPTPFNCLLATSTPTLSPDRSSNSVPTEICVLNYTHCERCSGTEMYVPLKQQNLGSSSQMAVGSSSWEPTLGARLPCQGPGADVPKAGGSSAVRAPCGHMLQELSVPCAAGGVSRGQCRPTAKGETSEYSEGSTTEDDEMDCVDVTPVRDTGHQSGFEKHQLHPQAKPLSPETTAKKVMTLKGLLGELKVLVASKADCEAVRLIAEVEQSVDLLPSFVSSTSIQAEIALAMQPLRSENAQLRRRLRILNQQLMERERAEREARPADCNFELISLQSMNMSLQSQLKEAQKVIATLQKRNEDLQQENSQLRKAMEDKQRELHEGRQQCELDISRIKIDVDAALLEMKSCQAKLEASEEENSLLTLRLQRMEAEVIRLKELTRNLPANQSGVSVPHQENDASSPTSRLTKKVLDLFEDEQETASAFDPISDSIHTFLKTLDARGQVPLERQYSTDKSSIHRGCNQRGAQKGQESSHTGSTEENFPLGKDPESGKTTYVPLKETVRQSVSPPKWLESKITTQNGHEPKISSHSLERLHLSKGPLASSAVIGNIECDITVEHSDGSHPSSCKNVKTVSEHQHLSPVADGRVRLNRTSGSTLDSTFLSCEAKSMVSNWSTNSWSTFNTQDEMDFRSGLAALDASIASLQKTIQSDLKI